MSLPSPPLGAVFFCPETRRANENPSGFPEGFAF